MSWTVYIESGAEHTFSTLGDNRFTCALDDYRVSTCDACGAVVMDDDAAKHARWHETLVIAPVQPDPWDV